MLIEQPQLMSAGNLLKRGQNSHKFYDVCFYSLNRKSKVNLFPAALLSVPTEVICFSSSHVEALVQLRCVSGHNLYWGTKDSSDCKSSFSGFFEQNTEVYVLS